MGVRVHKTRLIPKRLAQRCRCMLRALPGKRQATDQVLTFFKGMSKFAECGSVSATWYLLEDSARAIGSFDVKRVPILPMSSAAAASVFYPPGRGQRGAARYPPKRPRIAPGANAEQPENRPGHQGSLGDGSASGCEGDTDGSEGQEDDDMEEDGLAELLDEVSETLLQALDLPDDADADPSHGAASDAPDGAVAPSHASSPVAPPPPPPPEDEPARARGKAAVTVVFPWGKIAYYASKNSFEAICRNPAHGKCVLTRSAKAKTTRAGRPPAGGRPVGFMAAWLQHGDVASKADHWSPDVLRAPLAARKAGRAFVKGARYGTELLSYERPMAADQGETSEPEDISAYA